MNRGAWWAIICGVTEGSDMIIYMFQCHCPISSHPCPLPQSPKHCSVHLCQGSVLRWQRNRMGRPLSPPQIHRKSIWAEQIPQKNFWMLVENISSVQFSRSVMSDSLWPNESQHARPPCPSQTHHKRSMPIELVMPSSHLILCCPLPHLPPILPSIRIFSNESTLHMRWPKYRSFSFSISPSNEHPGLISFRMD